MSRRTGRMPVGAHAGELYPRLLGAAWHDLDPAVQRFHAPGAVVHATGTFRVRHARVRFFRMLLRAVRLPRPGESVTVRLTVSRRGAAERWARSFNGAALVSIQEPGPGGVLVERMGPLELRFRLAAVGGALDYRSAGAALRLGPLSLPLPTTLAPQVSSREEAAGGRDEVRVMVEVAAPTGALLLGYEGTIRIKEAPP